MAETDDPYFIRKSADPDTWLPPLDGEWYVADGIGFIKHPTPERFAKLMERSLQLLPEGNKLLPPKHHG